MATSYRRSLPHDAAKKARHRKSSGVLAFLEQLERRETPATLVSPTTVTYQDIDGDNVTVVFSRPILTVANVNQICVFDAGSVSGSNTNRQQLLAISLATVNATAAGVSLTTRATRSVTNGGDGFAALGQVVATGVDLGIVTIDGDLGRLRAGDATAGTPGLKSLSVLSLGRFGGFTGASDLQTEVNGSVGAFNIKGDVKDASISVHGEIGLVIVGGSLIGGAVGSSGRIASSGKIGVVTIGGDVLGGGGKGSGALVSSSGLGSVAIGGSLIGGEGYGSGLVMSEGAIGAVKIGGDVLTGANASNASNDHRLLFLSDAGSIRITGNVRYVVEKVAALISNQIQIEGKLGSLAIGGGLIDARIEIKKATGTIAINRDMTGMLLFFDTLASLTVGGSVHGGRISLENSVGAVRIGGGVIGTGGLHSGFLNVVGSLNSLTIGGDVLGGAGLESGFLNVFGNLNSLTIGGSLVSGTATSATQSGCVRDWGTIGNLVIRGSVVGNSRNRATVVAYDQKSTYNPANRSFGSISVFGRVEWAEIGCGRSPFERFDENADARIGQVRVCGDWIASSLFAGAISTNAFYGDGDDAKAGAAADDVATLSSCIGSVTIGGQVLGSRGEIPFGKDHFGIVAEEIGVVRIGGTLLPLNKGVGNDNVAVGITGDFRVREI